MTARLDGGRDEVCCEKSSSVVMGWTVQVPAGAVVGCWAVSTAGPGVSPDMGADEFIFVDCVDVVLI